ncbi:MAG: hypothetical protein ABSG41_29235 [Bryobacteraceae bacterium]
MGKLTGTQHGDAANDLLAFYEEESKKLESAGFYFMAAIALGFALESAVLTYLLVEWGDDNGGELKVPDNVAFSDLIEAAKELDLLSAPTIVPPGLAGDVEAPKHLAKDVVDTIRRFRNLIHPARALKESFTPASFTADDLRDFKDKYWSVVYSLLYNL